MYSVIQEHTFLKALYPSYRPDDLYCGIVAVWIVCSCDYTDVMYPHSGLMGRSIITPCLLAHWTLSLNVAGLYFIRR